MPPLKMRLRLVSRLTCCEPGLDCSASERKREWRMQPATQSARVRSTQSALAHSGPASIRSQASSVRSAGRVQSPCPIRAAERATTWWPKPQEVALSKRRRAARRAGASWRMARRSGVAVRAELVGARGTRQGPAMIAASLAEKSDPAVARRTRCSSSRGARSTSAPKAPVARRTSPRRAPLDRTWDCSPRPPFDSVP
jgi:hypothetical protein